MAFPDGHSFGGFAGLVDGASADRAPSLNSEQGAAAAGGGVSPIQPAASAGPDPWSMEALAAKARIPLPVAEGYLAYLGCTLGDAAEDFAFIPPEELEVALSGFVVGGVAATALQRGQATRLVAATHAQHPGPRTIQEITAPPAAAEQPAPALVVQPAPQPPAAPKRKYSEVLDQGDGQVYEDLPADKAHGLRAAHTKITGGPPPDDARPTTEQLSALHARMDAGRAPFADFAIWGPFGRRATKLLKYTAQVFVEGALQTRMLKGPSSYEAWRGSLKVFRSAMLMLEAARPSTLDGYEEGVRQLSLLFPQGWGTIATVEETVRAEQWDILREQIPANTPAGYDADMPWDFVIAQSTYGVPGAIKAHFWEMRVVLPLLRGASAGSAAATSAQMEGAPPVFENQVVHRPPRAQPKRGKGGQKGQRPPPTQTGPIQYCWAWNRDGNCQRPCPQGRVHRCEHCDGSHRGRDCPKAGGKTGTGKGKKGGGKGNPQL